MNTYAITDESAYMREENIRAQLKELYFDDLREVLNLPAGRRVLFNWLDAAMTFGLISAGGEATIRNAAVSDFGRMRLLEIQAADPEGIFKIMRANDLRQGDKQNA